MNGRITALGEILYDVYPGQKRLGGAPFNFIYHIWKILGQASFISNVGNDDNGVELLNYLNNIGFNTSFISMDKIHSTGTVQVKIREDKTPQFTISAECCYDYLELTDAIKNKIENETDILYFGTLSQRSPVSRKTINSLLGYPIKYFCDLNLRHNFFSKEMIETALQTVSVLKVNSMELEKLIGMISLSKLNPAAELLSKYSIDLIAVTYGEEGAILYSKSQISEYKSKKQSIVDSLGAGDAFAAVLCLGYLKNLPIETINRLANEFALEICNVEGALPTKDTVYDGMRSIFKVAYK